MFKNVFAYAGAYKSRTYEAMGVMLVALIAYVAQYAFLFQIIRPLLEHEALGVAAVLPWVLAILACGIFHALLYVRGLSISHDAAFNILRNLRCAMQSKLERQPLGTIQDKGTGTPKKLFIDDVDSIELLLAHALPEGLANLLVPAIVYVAMFFVDWKLALLSLCSLPLGILCSAIMYKVGMGRMGAYYGSAQKMNVTIIEYVNGMEVVKVFNRDGESYRRFEDDIRSYRDLTIDWYRASWPWMALYGSILPCVAMVVLPVGSWFVIQGFSTLPDLVLVLCLGFGIGAPLMRAMSFISVMPQINHKIEALESALVAAPLKQADAPFYGNGHGIRFDDARFSYADEEVLHGVSLDVPEGSTVALVGESGSGKSTLARLLVHYYDLDGGAIEVGGQNLCDMSLEALNEQISYVSQEQFLFNTILRENIRMGKPGATDEEVDEAAQRAQCADFLAKLPDGLDANAGDSGRLLSGGQRQRVSLARALLKDAPIVVLDEATAFMDPENEERMGRAIASIIEGKTVVVIAHRLQTIVGADEICVMDAGRIVDRGTHGELLERCERYQSLWEASCASSAWRVSTKREEENHD